MYAIKILDQIYVFLTCDIFTWTCVIVGKDIWSYNYIQIVSFINEMCAFQFVIQITGFYYVIIINTTITKGLWWVINKVVN